MASFDQSLGRVLVFGDQYPAEVNQRLVQALPVSLAKNVGRPASFSDYVVPDRNNFAPRLGFAWQPISGSSFVIRAAYGIFYYVIANNRYKDVAAIGTNIPFISNSTFTADPTKPSISMSDPFPGSGTLPRNPSVNGIEPGGIYRNPYSQEWNFTLEKGLKNGMGLRASYIGQKGTRLLTGYDANAVKPVAGTNMQDLRPYQPFASILTESSRLSATTHQLQAGMQKRFSKGYAVQFEYQFTRAIGEDSVDDPFNIRLSRGNLSGIRRHGLVGNYVYELPFGAGKPFLNWKGPAGVIIGGWQVNGITTIFSGAPYSVVYQNSVAGCPGFARANIIGDPNVASPNTGGFFNPAAFAPGGCVYAGTSAKNLLFGPHQNQWDVGISKLTNITEQVKLQFRTEIFNIANHPQFGLPGNNISSPGTVGIISSSSNERQIQFALKLLY